MAITRRDDTARLPAVAVPAFTGRDRELAALAGTLESGPSVVLVEGEAGIGKTRLLEEFLASRPGRAYRTLVARFQPFRQPDTLGPLADALRQAVGDVTALPLSDLAGALRPLFPEWAAALPPAPEPAQDATVARHRLFRALDELLGCLQVTLLVAEDVHWADEATLEFLLLLASRQPARLSLVVTCRPEDLPAGSLLPHLTARCAPGTNARRITLGPLDVTGIAGLVSSMLDGERPSSEFAAFVHQRTDGVPVAAEESIRLMVERAELYRCEGGWFRRSLADIEVPATIRESVLERAQRLPPDAQAVLRASAVLAEPSDDTAIAAVAGISASRARAGLAAGLASRLLTAGPQNLVQFRHVLACQAVYEATPGPELRMLHLQAGLTLEDAFPPPLVRLARHFREAGERVKWCQYGEQAADLALASGDEATAAVLLHDLATSAGLPASAVARITQKIPFISLSVTARCQELVVALRSILAARNLEPAEEADIRFELGRVLAVMEETGASRAELKMAVPHLGHAPCRAALAMVRLGWPENATDPASVHLRWLRRAAKVMPSLPPEQWLRVQVDRACALLMLGEEEGWVIAAQIPDNAAASQSRQQITRGQLNAGGMALVWGRYSEARTRLAKALELAESYQYPRYRETILAALAHLDWLSGRWDGLDERSRPLADNAETQPGARLDAALVVGLLHAARGENAQAADRFRHVLAERRRQGLLLYTIEPSAAMARLWLAAGRAGDAQQVTDAPIRIVAQKNLWVWAADLAVVRVAALAEAGSTGAASELVTAFARGLRGRNAPAPRAGLATCRAILADARGERTRAATLFAGAAAAWQALPRPYESLLARERQVGCLLAGRQPEHGLALLCEVLPGLSRLGATGDADRVAELLRKHGIAARRPWRGGQRGYGNQLSPRELDVVRLVLTGQTNPQIARALSRSPKTVAAQLNSAMRKLGVGTRTALAVKAVKAGLIPDDNGGNEDRTAYPQPGELRQPEF
jgi:DNA-binding CsgD family transcriptional regulator